MEAHEAVRLFVNKELVPEAPKRPGFPGYPRLQAVRALVYSILKVLEALPKGEDQLLRKVSTYWG